MPSELLIKATSTGSVPKGAIISIRPGGWEWGVLEGLPSFIRITISNATARNVAQYFGGWESTPVQSALSVTGNVVRLRWEGSIVGGSGEGAITEIESRSLIESMKGIFVSSDSSGVVFELTAFDVLTSSRFWEKNLDGVIFTELDVSGGVYTISVDFSSKGWHRNKVASILERRAEVVEVSNSTAIFMIDRQTAQEFVEMIAHRHLRKTIRGYRYRFADASVDQVVSIGGSQTVTKAQVLNNITDEAA